MPEIRHQRHVLQNLKRSLISFKDAVGSWYVLDNAAVIMPAVSDRQDTFLFRMSATLDHPVKVTEMNLALAAVSLRFPYYLVELRRGLFHYYMQPLPAVPTLELDSGSPCTNFCVKQHGQFMFRVRAAGNRVACEFNHALSDGTGCMTFLKALLVEYFRLLGVDSKPAPDIFRPQQPVDPAEMEDAYHRYYRPEVPGPPLLPPAFHIDSPFLPKMVYRVTSARLPLPELLAAARSRGASLTELLTAALLEAWLEEYRATTRRQKKRLSGHNIAIEVPVNLRKIYPAKTMRNFSLYVMVCLDGRLGSWTFEELVKYVHHTMRIENDERKLAQQIKRNAGGMRHLLVRLVPLWIKDIFGRLLFYRLGQALITSFISNLGVVELPPEITPHVRRFDFIPAPSRDTRSNASVLSWQDSVYINFGSRVVSREIERRFFSRLAAIGIPVMLDPVMEVENGSLFSVRS